MIDTCRTGETCHCSDLELESI